MYRRLKGCKHHNHEYTSKASEKEYTCIFRELFYLLTIRDSGRYVIATDRQIPAGYASKTELKRWSYSPVDIFCNNGVAGLGTTELKSPTLANHNKQIGK